MWKKNTFMRALITGCTCHVDADECPLPACLAGAAVPPAAPKTMSIDNKQRRTDTARC